MMIKKLLIWLVSLVLLSMAGYKGAVWWQTYAWLDRVRDSLAERGVVSWGGISSSFRGEVQISDLRLELFDLNSPLQVDSLSLVLPSPVTLVRYLAVPSGFMPERWSLRLDGLSMALKEDMLKSWAPLPARSAGPLLRPLGLFACGDRPALSFQDLIAMGIPDLALDVTLDYQSGRADEVARLRMEVSAGALGSLEAGLVSYVPANWPAVLAGDALPPVPEQLNLTFRDGGMMRRLAAYCGRLAGRAPTTWARSASVDWQIHLLSFGLLPSRQLVALYKTWLQDGGELQLVFQPLDSFRYDQFSGYSPNDALRLSGLQVLYNATRVPDIGMELDRERFTAALAAVAGQTPAAVSLPAVTERPQALPETAGFRVTSPDSAERWVGYTVRVTLSSGRDLEGRLQQTSSTQLDIVRLVNDGEVTYPIARDQITAFSVWQHQAER